jgi:hypothetical protein
MHLGKLSEVDVDVDACMHGSFLAFGVWSAPVYATTLCVCVGGGGGGGGGGWGLVSIYSSTVHITRKFSSTCTNDWRYTLPAQGRRSRDKVELL